ncbi:MAG: sigma-54 interaction domain-containing protein, partial [Maioricimonas sp. JB049]
IRGESGTGKELLAKSIHDNSDRRHGPLVTVHCAALSPSLLESELFGHVKGAFTDAREDKVGRFALADGGSLFLDEIGDVSLDVQVKLLRVLQERTFEPVGGSRSMTVDVRLMAATHQNLERLIAAGKFREDLYYRLNVITVTLPPLRERRDDIFELAVHFLRRATERSGKRIVRMTDEALEALRQYDWPGNIRELQNVMERAVVLADGEQITLGDLPHEVQTGAPLRLTSDVVEVKSSPVLLTHAAAPRQHAAARRSRRRDPMQEQAELQAALNEAEGNKAEAARLLGLPRSTFYSKLKKFGLG